MLGYALSVRGNEHAGRVVENLREALDALFDRRPRFLGKLALLNVDENADAVTPPRLMERRTGSVSPLRSDLRQASSSGRIVVLPLACSS